MGRTACTEPQCLYKGALYLTFYVFRHYCVVFRELVVLIILNTESQKEKKRICEILNSITNDCVDIPM